MTRLRPAAFFLLAALPGAAWAACNPVGTEDCCTKVVDEECTSADWPFPSGEIEFFQTSDGKVHFRLPALTGSRTYQGVKIETWIPIEPRITCPPDRRTPFTGDIRTYVTWKMTQNGEILAEGSGMEAISPDSVSGIVLCTFTVRSYAGVCDSQVDSYNGIANFDKDEALKAHLTINPENTLSLRTVLPRYSTNPAGRPILPCQFWIEEPLSEPLVVCFTGSRIRFEPGTVQTIYRTLPAGETELWFDISGQEWSDAMEDAPVVARKGSKVGEVLAEDKATVLWVEPISIQTKQDMPLFDDDVKAPNNSNRTLPNPPKTGIQSYRIPGTEGIGYVVQLSGLVHPAGFNQELFFARDYVDVWNSVELNDEPVPRDWLPPNEIGKERLPIGSQERGNDNPPVEFQHRNPSVSGGIIIDVDMPGWKNKDLVRLAVDEVLLSRINFVEYVLLWPDIGAQSRIRCSDDFPWHVKLTLKRMNSSTEPKKWNRPGHSDDNCAGPGFTSIPH